MHRTVRLGDEDVRIERPTGRKASTALAILKGVGDLLPELVVEVGRFTQEYERAHVIELDRAQAAMRYPPEAVYGETARKLGVPDGHVIPSRIAHMTEQDWERSGQVLRLPRSPSMGELMAAMAPKLLDRMEVELARLMALLIMGNAEVKRAWRAGDLSDRVKERADDLLDDVPADELLTLVVEAGELIDETFRSRIEAIGRDRLGKALRLLGLDLSQVQAQAREAMQTSSETPQTDLEEEALDLEARETQDEGGGATSETEPSPSRSNGSTPSAPPTDGGPTPSSTSPSTSSSPSAPASTSDAA